MLEKEQHGRVLRLALNRPEKRNALNCALCQAILEAVESAVHDASVSVILLVANGKSFCAGMDLEETALHETDANLHERLFTLGVRCTKPIVAAVSGAALGGGTGLVANCHIAIAEAGATFGLTEIRLGLWPFLVYRSVALALGERRTLELALTGRIFDSQEARDFGFVHEIAPDAEKRGMEVAELIASYSPLALQSGLSFVQEVRGKDWEEAGRVGRLVRDRVFAGVDFQEGLRAFREKRSPKWPSLGN